MEEALFQRKIVRDGRYISQVFIWSWKWTQGDLGGYIVPDNRSAGDEFWLYSFWGISWECGDGDTKDTVSFWWGEKRDSIRDFKIIIIISKIKENLLIYILNVKKEIGHKYIMQIMCQAKWKKTKFLWFIYSQIPIYQSHNRSRNNLRNIIIRWIMTYSKHNST